MNNPVSIPIPLEKFRSKFARLTGKRVKKEEVEQDWIYLVLGGRSWAKVSPISLEAWKELRASKN